MKTKKELELEIVNLKSRIVGIENYLSQVNCTKYLGDPTGTGYEAKVAYCPVCQKDNQDFHYHQ
mgnify:FL=1